MEIFGLITAVSVIVVSQGGASRRLKRGTNMYVPKSLSPNDAVIPTLSGAVSRLLLGIGINLYIALIYKDIKI